MLYRSLLAIADNPMARRSHAIAVGMAEGPRAGLALLDPLEDPRIAYRVDVARARPSATT